MAGITTSSTLSTQFRNFFRKETLKWTEQELVFSQFAKNLPVTIPKGSGAKGITAFRWGNPAITDVQALTEGTVPANSTARALAISAISKSLVQYGEHTVITDILKMQNQYDAYEQAIKTLSKDMALHFETVTRNVLRFTDLAASNGSLGAAVEVGPDNSDTQTKYYGAHTGTQTWAGLNSATTVALAAMTATMVLDSMTKLTINRAPTVKGGGYICVSSPQGARDMMRDVDWLAGHEYSDIKALYKGEVGSFYGVRFVLGTAPFIATGSATAGDEYVYATAAADGLTAGSRVYTSFFMGDESFGVPSLTGEDPVEPEIIVAEGADKADPYAQLTTIALKSYWTALRTNPAWCIIQHHKTAYA